MVKLFFKYLMLKNVLLLGTTTLNKQDGPRLVTSATDPTRVGTCPPPPPRSAAEMLKTGHQLIGYVIRKMFIVGTKEQVGSTMNKIAMHFLASLIVYIYMNL
jgi:hypothetical protein